MSSATAARAGNTLVVAGGFSGGSVSSTVHLFHVDGTVTQTNLPGNTPAVGFSATSTGSSAYFGGGADSNFQVLPRVYVYTVTDELVADVASLSLAVGSDVNFELDSGPPAAGDVYLLLGTAVGTSPGITIDGVLLPLNIGPYFLTMLKNANKPPFKNTFGLLDAGGEGAAAITFPPGSPPELAGFTFDHAFVRIDLGLGKVVAASNLQSIDLLP